MDSTYSDSGNTDPTASGFISPHSSPARFGGFWIRFLGYLIDSTLWGVASMLILTATMFLLFFPILSETDSQATSPVGVINQIFAVQFVFMALFQGLLLAYFVALPVLYGGTFGMRAVGYSIVGPDGKRIGWIASLVRALGMIASSMALYAGFLWVTVDPRRRAWHDLIANTFVVRTSTVGTPIEAEETSAKPSYKWLIIGLGIQLAFMIVWFAFVIIMTILSLRTNNVPWL